jgi:hypothetical protein
MTFWPAGFDPRSSAISILKLIDIETPDGNFGFMLSDGIFTDVNSKEWWGSSLISVGDTEIAINGTAPSGSITLSFIQDDQAPDLIEQIRALGVEYVAGRKLRFYLQPLNTVEEFWAPVHEPVLFATRTMRKITISASGALERSISVSYEGPFEYRNGTPRMIYNTTDHSQLIGEENPSLTYMPTDNRRDEKIWG